MKSKIYILAFSFIIFMSCTNENDINKHGLKYSDFENNLKSDMTFNSIVATFGEPSNDIGSGIHIYVYQLSDSTELWIGYTDKILYARYVDENGQIIENLF